MAAAPKLAGAPITWGVCEVPGWGRQLDPSRVLAEIAGAGLSATELGPQGFLPADASAIRARLAEHGLTLVGGFVPAVLHRDHSLASELERVDASARTLADAGAGVLVLAAETGSGGYEVTTQLSDVEWRTLEQGIAEVMRIGARYQLGVALHPHYGTVIERAAEVKRVLDTTDVGLCLDTGHLMVAGADPVEIAKYARGRVVHVHLKDVDASLAARVRSREIGYRDAVSAGLYRPLGDGDVDIATLVRLLRDAGYDGWYVMEQDLVLDGLSDDTPLRNASRSMRYLRTLWDA